MEWVDGHVRVNHSRLAWGATIHRDIIIHSRLDSLLGTWAGYLPEQKARIADLYDRAKFKFDMEAAFDLVEAVIDEQSLDAIADVIVKAGTAPIFVYPYPAFDDDDAVGAAEALLGPTNAIPFAYAGYLTKVMGGAVCETITQAARVGRTKLTRWFRYLCQPTFVGEVAGGRPYILLDDVVTSGGTLAALRSYITEAGGKVIAATCLAHKDGRSHQFAVAQDTLNVLVSFYGEGLRALWAQKVGHDIECLTNAEAEFLCTWAAERERDYGWSRGAEMLQRLRDRLDEAATKGR